MRKSAPTSHSNPLPPACGREGRGGRDFFLLGSAPASNNPSPLDPPSRKRAGGKVAAAMITACLLLSACEVGPNYHRPPVATPPAYKEIGKWVPAQPADGAPRGPWWSAFNDPVLDGLESQVSVNNQNLKASEAAYREALDVVREAQAGFYPEVDLNGNAQRSQPLRNGGSASGASTGVVSGNGDTVVGTSGGSGRRGSNSFSLSANATWEPDVWGRVRRTVESDKANAQASKADLASATLSAQGTLAVDYFELRETDQLKRLLDQAVAFDKKTLTITQNQYKVGVAAKSDVVQAETLVDSTLSQEVNTGILRAQLEHAIAVLTGKPPEDFSLAQGGDLPMPPAIPASVPSTLLQRQPAVAEAERNVAAASAQIGVAEAAYFPDMTLSATDVFSAATLGKLLNASNNVWTIGPQLAYTLFDGGLRHAQVKAAKAAYDQQVALYRQEVLTAFQNVEDQLAALNVLQQQVGIQDRAVAEAQESVNIVLNQYKAGTVVYTNVVTVETSLLTAMQTALTLRENRLTSSVQLIEALGGGWDASALAKK
jgi:NodT family efflux transporter outer membrane factor (OMF) lipoprotein